MGLVWHWSDKMGELHIKQNENTFCINIYAGNCLAIFISEYKKDGEDKYDLYSFFADERHCKNILKDNKSLFWDEVVKIRLNLFFKEANTLLKILTKNGYEVECYYEKIERDKQ